MSLDASFSVLIPKKGRVKDIKKSGPIILIWVLSRLLAKILANRLSYC